MDSWCLSMFQITKSVKVRRSVLSVDPKKSAMMVLVKMMLV